MTLDDIRVTKKPLVLAKPADVDALESRLWITFPDGYREYVTRLGEGTLGGSLVRIYPPGRIENELDDWRRRIQKYWFWDRGKKLRPSRLFVLPRDHEQIFEAGGDLLSAIDWMCSSGKLVEPFTEREFEPFDSRKLPASPAGADDAPADPEGESLDNLVDLARQWAKRHKARDLARKELKKTLDAPVQQQTTATLISEAVVFDGQYPDGDPGYRAVFRINDKSTKRERGTFTYQKSSDGHFTQYAPKN